MTILENINTIVSLICGVLSMVMFLLAKNQKDKCIEISNNIEQKIQILNKQSYIASNDEFNIHTVDKFDNRKSLK